jgi:hypothetical protein
MLIRLAICEHGSSFKCTVMSESAGYRVKHQLCYKHCHEMSLIAYIGVSST